MRDPLRPIPSPASARDFWDRAAPPPPPARRGPGATKPGTGFDPTRILRNHEPDALGLDRRTSRRASQQPGGSEVGAATVPVASAMHETVRGVLGLCTVHGWALVETLTVSPQGVLVRHVDASDRDLSCETRVAINRALVALSPVMGAPLRRGRPWADALGRNSSPLANVGTHLLGQRVVADASNWAHARRAQGAKTRENLQVTLILPPRGRVQRRGLAQLPQVEGRLSALNDPDPRVLGVALDACSVRELRFHLQLRGGA